MTELFNRQIKLTVGTYELEGYRIRFSITKDDTRDPNQAEIHIDNLSREARSTIAAFTPDENSTRGIPVKLEIGYETLGEPQQIWLGDLRTSISQRNGPTWTTSIATGSGEVANQTARINQSFGPRTPVETVVRALVDKLGIGQGNLKDVLSDLAAGNTGKLALDGATLHGSVAYHLDNWTRAAGMSWSIQDGVLTFRRDDQPLTQQAVVLKPSTGLVGTPQLEMGDPVKLSAVSFIQPGLDIGRIVSIESDSIDVGGIDSVRGSYVIKRANYVGDTHASQWYVNIEAIPYVKIVN